MSKKDCGIDEKRLGLVIWVLEKFADKTWQAMDAEAKAKVICQVYAVARDDIPALTLIDALRDIKIEADKADD